MYERDANALDSNIRTVNKSLSVVVLLVCADTLQFRKKIVINKASNNLKFFIGMEFKFYTKLIKNTDKKINCLYLLFYLHFTFHQPSGLEHSHYSHRVSVS